MRAGIAYGAIVAVGLGLSGAAGWMSFEASERVAARQVRSNTEAATNAIQAGLDRMAILIRAVKGAYTADEPMTQPEFARFVGELTDAENYRSVAFVRLVRELERPDQERAMRARGNAPDGIWERSSDGQPIPSPPRPVHFVLEAGMTNGGPPPAVGYDLVSLPDRKRGIETAIATRSLYILGPLTFPDSGQSGLVFYVPAFDRDGVPVGVALGTLTVDALVRLASLASGVSDIQVMVSDRPVAEAGASRAPKGFVFGQRFWQVSTDASAADRGPLIWITILIVGSSVASTLALLGFAAVYFQNRRVAQARAELGAMLDGLGPLAWLLAPDGTILAANRSAAEAFQLSDKEMIGRPFWATAREDRPGPTNQLRRAIATARSSGSARFDLALEIDNLQKVFDFWIRSLDPALRRDANLVVSAIDVTSRHEVQETQRLLTRELDHRMKNTLQVIQAVIRRTALTQPSVADFEASLAGRIKAMSRAHELLAGERWSGAEIESIVREELSSVGTSGQIVIRGPRLRLNPKAALAFALTLHELGTNAVKYGALSTTEGRVDVSWRIEPGNGEPAFLLLWEESGGPVVREPGKPGFGSSLIQRSIAYELDGKTVVEHRPEGLRCHFKVPLSTVRPTLGGDVEPRDEPAAVREEEGVG